MKYLIVLLSCFIMSNSIKNITIQYETHSEGIRYDIFTKLPEVKWRKDENGFPHGDWIYYHKDGSLSIIVTYHHGKETYRKSFAPASAKSLGE